MTEVHDKQVVKIKWKISPFGFKYPHPHRKEKLDFDACVVCWVPELFFFFPSHILIFQCSKVTNETFPAKPLAKNDWPAYIRRPKLK